MIADKKMVWFFMGVVYSREKINTDMFTFRDMNKNG